MTNKHGSNSCAITSYFIDDQKKRCQYLTYDQYRYYMKEHDHAFYLLVGIRHTRFYDLVDGGFHLLLISDRLDLFDNIRYHCSYIILKICNKYIMLLVWLLVLFIAFVLALFFIPRKEPHVPTPEEIHKVIKIKHAMEIVEEKDTKRFYEDIRSLYPL